MGNEKFTPGEWEFSGGGIYIRDTHIAEVYASYNSDYEEEQEANGNLIAAAPEMYKELENIEDYLRFLVAGCVAGSGRAKALWAFIDRIIAIRKKARGEI